VLVAAVLVYSPAVLLTLVLLALGAIGLLEMYGLLSRTGPSALPSPLGLGLVGLLVLSAANARLGLLNVSVFLTVVAPLLWSMVVAAEPRAESVRLWALSAAGALYVGWPLAHVELLRQLPDGEAWLVLAIACTWATDTGAYIFGSLFGSRKLAPSISPGKTVEGSFGALLVTAPVGALVGGATGLGVGVWVLMLVSLGLSVAAQAGDLAESYMKRAAGVKDSGRILPGHGGLLDRIDGLLWVVVVAYYLAYAVL
jgi:phosphatidate cytidylyltransferase